MIDPSACLAEYGFSAELKKGLLVLSRGDAFVQGRKNDEGVFQWCSSDGTAIGDNYDLLCDIIGLGVLSADHLLRGCPRLVTAASKRIPVDSVVETVDESALPNSEAEWIDEQNMDVDWIEEEFEGDPEAAAECEFEEAMEELVVGSHSCGEDQR